MPQNRLRLLTLLVSVFSVSQALYSAWDQGWAVDERIHLEWSRRLLATGEDERESLARFESKTPVVLPNVLMMNAAQAMGVAGEARQRFAARLVTVACLAALLYATFRLARTVFGERAACLAAIAAALDPNLPASGSIVTVDVAYALGVVLTASAALAFVREPTLRRGTVLGLAVGLVFTAKFSAVLLLPALVLLPVVGPPLPARAQRYRRLASGIVVGAAVAAAFLCTAYLFVGVGRRFADIPLASRPFATVARLLPGLRLPLPASFLTGIDHSIVRDTVIWRVYINGVFYNHGVWFYFPYHWLLKTPVFVLLAEIAGLALLARGGGLWRNGAARFLAVILVVHLAFFSFLFSTQIGYRFVLMCVPLAYILAAGGLAALEPGRATLRIAALVVMVALVENLQYWGNPLAFTNAAVWPKRLVWRRMADSNVDYGQDRERIGPWLLDARMPDAELNPLHLLPGHVVINLNVFVGLPDPERFRWLREHVPNEGHIGYTHLFWVIDDETYDRYMDEERTRTPSAAAGALCGDPSSLTRYPPGTRLPLEIDEPPGRLRAFVACVSVRKPTDFALKSDGGAVLRFGAYRDGASGPVCAPEELNDGQIAWHRLAPGLHAFCVEEVPNARNWLPYRFSGAWRVRANGMGFALRETGGGSPAHNPPPPP
jgi:hypothetical protein